MRKQVSEVVGFTHTASSSLLHPGIPRSEEKLPRGAQVIGRCSEAPRRDARSRGSRRA